MAQWLNPGVVTSQYICLVDLRRENNRSLMCSQALIL